MAITVQRSVQASNERNFTNEHMIVTVSNVFDFMSRIHSDEFWNMATHTITNTNHQCGIKKAGDKNLVARTDSIFSTYYLTCHGIKSHCNSRAWNKYHRWFERGQTTNTFYDFVYFKKMALMPMSVFIVVVRANITQAEVRFRWHQYVAPIIFVLFIQCGNSLTFAFHRRRPTW